MPKSSMLPYHTRDYSLAWARRSLRVSNAPRCPKLLLNRCIMKNIIAATFVMQNSTFWAVDRLYEAGSSVRFIYDKHMLSMNKPESA